MPALGEPAADHHVEAAAVIEGRQQLGDVLGDVLTVGVDLHDAVVAVLHRVAEAGAQGAARRPG